MKAFSSGPPNAILVSGRFESTARSPYRGLSALLQVAVTPARTNATIRSRVAASRFGDTTSATDTARVQVVRRVRTRTRTADDSPNQPKAGLSSVDGCWAESTACAGSWSCIRPKPRPITASPTSLTGIAPGTGHGQRSRSSRSAPVNSSMVVRQSTRSTPCHRVIVWV